MATVATLAINQSDIQDRPVRSITTVLKYKEVASRIEGLGAEIMVLTGGELNRYVQGEREKWARVIRQANIKVD